MTLTTSRSTAPIDRGWAWVIVMAAFMNLALLIGISKCLGIIFAELIELYHGSASATSTMFALSAGLSLFIAPIVTTFSDIYTCRLVSVIGGVVCCLGFLVPAFCNTLEQIVLTLGILTGLGYGICLTPSAIIVGRYFERRRSLANGLMFSGSGVGGMLIPLFLNYIIQLFGLHGALLIVAGLALQTVVFSALYRPLEYWKRKDELITEELIRPTDKEVKTVNFDFDAVDIENENLNRRRLSSTGLDRKIVANLRPHASASLLADKKIDTLSINQMPRVKEAESSMTMYFSATSLATWLSVPDIYRSAVYHHQGDNGDKEENRELEPVAQKLKPAPTGNGYRNIFKRVCYVKASDGSDLPLFDLGLLKNINFDLFIIGSMFLLTSTYIGMIVPPHCLELGMSKTEVAVLLSVQGGADTAGRLLAGFFGDRPFVKSKRKSLCTLCCLVCAISSFASVFLTSFWSLMAYLIVCSLAVGSFIATIPVVLVDLVGIENLSRAWGLTAFVEGFSVTLSPVIIGALRDWTLTYASGLIFIAACFMLSTICIFCMVIMDWTRSSSGGPTNA